MGPSAVAIALTFTAARFSRYCPGKCRLTTKRHPLSAELKRANRQINSLRVVVEHAIRRLKVFRLLGERYRNRRKRFGLRLDLIAALTGLQ